MKFLLFLFSLSLFTVISGNPINETATKKVDENVCCWFGTSPFCDGKCQAGWQLIYEDVQNDFKCSPGWGQYACVTGSKVLCCSHKMPNRFEACKNNFVNFKENKCPQH